MFFRSGANNNGNNINLNTNLLTGYGDECMLVVGAWNRQLSLKIYPAKGKDENGITQYKNDTNDIITTSVTQVNAVTWLKGYTDELLPLIDGKQAFPEDKDIVSISIHVGKDENRKLLTIGYTKDGTAFFRIGWNLDDTGCAPSGCILTYKFKTYAYYKDADESNGTEGERVLVQAEFENFMEKVHRVQDLVPTIAHSINYNQLVRKAYSNNNNQNQNNNNYDNGSGMPAPINDGGDSFGGFPFN